MTMTGAHVAYLYDLMDAAIHDHSRTLGRAPIIDCNFRDQHEIETEWARKVSTLSGSCRDIEKLGAAQNCLRAAAMTSLKVGSFL